MASKGLAIRHTDLILSKLMDGSVSAGDRSKRLAALPVLLFSVSLIGCSGLTRPKAQHELDEQFKAEKISKTSMDEPPKLLLNYGLRSPYCYMEPSSARWVLNSSSKTHGPDDKERILVLSHGKQNWSRDLHANAYTKRPCCRFGRTLRAYCETELRLLAGRYAIC